MYGVKAMDDGQSQWQAEVTPSSFVPILFPAEFYEGNAEMKLIASVTSGAGWKKEGR